ncbi:MAG: hypothetical protein K2L72_01550 [Clostridia bacterium]|nr:hypothetical protein [Clostridia bacterium]
MKYIRKVMATGLALIFLIALVIGTGVIFSVRNVNVTFIRYSDRCEDAYNKTRSNLNKLKGSGLLFINSGDVYGKVSDPQLLVIESYEKKMPCTVNVVVRERVECFTLKTADGYNVYDDAGKLIKSIVADSAPLNSVDGCPNVIIEVQPDQVERVAVLCVYFKDEFGSLRRLVETVSVKKYLELQMATIKLRGGLTVSISDWGTDIQRKIKAAYGVYAGLDDLQRAGGTITVINGRDGSAPTAKYNV